MTGLFAKVPNIEASMYTKAVNQSTREAAIKDPKWVYKYAANIDQIPRDDTRKATLKYPKWAQLYARYVDKTPRNDTREATVPLIPTKGSSLRTDCDYNIKSFSELVHDLADDDVLPELLAGNEDVREYTFAEILEALQTEPDFNGHERFARVGGMLSALSEKDCAGH